MKNFSKLISKSFIKELDENKKISNIFLCSLNNHKILIVDLFAIYEEREEHFTYACIKNNKNLNIIGEARFELVNNEVCNLYEISLNDIKYQGKGIGTLLIEYIEYLTFNKNINKIIGRYMPFGPLSNKTPIFYKRHNYEFIENKKGKYIIKKLSKEDMQNNGYFYNKHLSIRRK